MKSLIYSLIILAGASTYAQRNDMGFDFDNTDLPSEVQALSDWTVMSSASDDFNYANKTNTKFTDTWAERYLPDPGFVGPGQTRWVQRNPSDAMDPGVIKVNAGNLEIRAYPGANNTLSSEPKKDRFIQCGVVTGKNQVKYPIYMEARIKVSNLENSSNFWMLNACDNEEIDILECYGGAKLRNDQGEVIGGDEKFWSAQMSTNFHIWHRLGNQNEPTDNGLENCGGGILTDFTYQTFFTTDPASNNFNSTPNWRDEFHTFGLLWTSPTNLQYFIDGVARDNGRHYVTGRQTSGLTGSLASSPLQCPNPNATSEECKTSEILANVQGQSSGGSPFPNRQMDDETFIIIDTESHFNRPLEDIVNLNDDGKNVLLVDWIRVYTPDSPIDVVEDRTRSISFDNRAEFIPSGQTIPEFEIGDTVQLDFTYQTGIVGGVEEDLDYVAIQLAELDKNGDRVALGPFVTVVPGTDSNMGQVQNFEVTIPSNYARTGDNSAAFTGAIPTTAELDDDHKLIFIIFMQVDGELKFANADTDIILVAESLSISDNIAKDEIVLSPNPFSSEFKIESQIEGVWKLYDLNGKIVAKGTGNTVDGSGLTSGVYLLSASGSTVKVIKE